MNILYLAIGLVILVIVNIVLGSMSSWFDGTFDWTKCWHGIVKGGIVILCFALVYLAGYINPSVMAIEISGELVTLAQAVYLIVLAGFIYYAYQVLNKMKNLIGAKIDIAENPPDIKTTE